jgi:hypothetical protein
MMRNDMHFRGGYPGRGFGPAPHRGGFGPARHHMGPGFGSRFRRMHHPRPFRSVWFGPGFYRRPRFYGGPGCLGCFVPFLMLLLLASAFGFVL